MYLVTWKINDGTEWSARSVWAHLRWTWCHSVLQPLKALLLAQLALQILEKEIH